MAFQEVDRSGWLPLAQNGACLPCAAEALMLLPLLQQGHRQARQTVRQAIRHAGSQAGQALLLGMVLLQHCGLASYSSEYGSTWTSKAAGCVCPSGGCVGRPRLCASLPYTTVAVTSSLTLTWHSCW